MFRKLKILGVPVFEIPGPTSTPPPPVQTDVPAEPEEEDPLDEIHADALKAALGELRQAGQELRVERIKLRVVRVRADVAAAQQQQTTQSP